MENALEFVHLQLTRQCNLRCSFCGQWGRTGFMKDSSRKQDLEFGDWKKAIDSIAAWSRETGVQPQFSLWGGEPLLSPSFVRVASLLNEYGFETGLVSNGTLLDRFASVINDTIRVLYISLDGPEPIHDRIRNSEGAFRKIARGLASIDSSRVRIIALTTICHDNYQHLAEFPHYVSRNLPGVNMIIFQNIIFVSARDARNYQTWIQQCFGYMPAHIGSWINEVFGTYVEELPGIISEISARAHDRSYPVEVRITPQHVPPKNIRTWYSTDWTPQEDAVCRMPYSHLQIRPDGNVDMCVDFDDFTAGNIRERDVMEIFNGPEAAKFRKICAETPPPICKRCPWRFNRTPGLDIGRAKIITTQASA